MSKKLSNEQITDVMCLFKINKTQSWISKELNIARITIRHIINPELRSQDNEKVKIRYRERKYDTINHYSNGKICCSCCGEKQYEFLTIEHENGGGTKHRKTIKGDIYAYLKRNNYPKEYDVLCCNCNWSSNLHNGVCIHNIYK